MEDDDANGRSDLVSEAVAHSPGPLRRLSFGLYFFFWFDRGTTHEQTLRVFGTILL
jgi:hypothetical protein